MKEVIKVEFNADEKCITLRSFTLPQGPSAENASSQSAHASFGRLLRSG